MVPIEQRALLIAQQTPKDIADVVKNFQLNNIKKKKVKVLKNKK